MVVVKVTGEKALFVNKGFTKRIIGLQHEESDALLQLLFNVSVGPQNCRYMPQNSSH